ncbi:MAG: NUDIX domain-containing protein [Thermoplasmata archaeon]
MDEPTGPVVQECVEGYLFAGPPVEVLVFRRPPSRKEIWVPVSGKVDPTDPDLESALRRELREETGLLDPRRIFPLDWHVRFRSDTGATWRLHAYGVEVDRSFSPTLSAEHASSKWVSPADALALLHYDDNREAVRRLLALLSSPPSPNA